MPDAIEFTLEPQDNDRLANLCGQFDEHMRQIEQRLDVQIRNRGNSFEVIGEAARAGSTVIQDLYAATREEVLSPERVNLFLQESSVFAEAEDAPEAHYADIRTRRGRVQPRGRNQLDYVASIRRTDLTFGIGPAGTGKTYLAVACAVEALESDLVRRLVLVRPAVEAGERLGFLPGDLVQKIDPYLRPIYDALYEMLGFERVSKLIDRNIVEIAPLAYMRGRTLNHAFVIMDEAQNSTIEQMKMFLTRIGFGSRAVVTGDITQIDLPKKERSGLKQVREVLSGVDGVRFVHFKSRDVVRHPLVQRIVDAYERAETAAHHPTSEKSLTNN